MVLLELCLVLPLIFWESILVLLRQQRVNYLAPSWTFLTVTAENAPLDSNGQPAENRGTRLPSIMKTIASDDELRIGSNLNKHKLKQPIEEIDPESENPDLEGLPSNQMAPQPKRCKGSQNSKANKVNFAVNSWL